MKRVGDIIEFDDGTQQRTFEETIFASERLENLIQAAMASVCRLECEARTWWRSVRQFCAENERAVYNYSTRTLRVEKIASTKERIESPHALLGRAKEAAVAIQAFDLAASIRDLMNSYTSEDSTNG